MLQGIVHLPSELWIKMITQLGDRLVIFMEHMRVSVPCCQTHLFRNIYKIELVSFQDVILLFQSCADSAIGRSSSDVAGTYMYDIK